MNGHHRPYISLTRPYRWLHQDGTETAGIALMAGPRVLAHLTPDEALNLSNQLVDLAEAQTQETR